jgi:hypothetical protein
LESAHARQHPLPARWNRRDTDRTSRRFIAFGARDNINQKILGVLLSNDGHHRIGGMTLKFGGGTENPTRWAVYFDVPCSIRCDRRFKLAVFDSQELPGNLTAQTVYTKNHLKFRKDHLGINAARRIEFPTTIASRADFYAYGTLPESNNDVDAGPEQTVVVDQANSANRYEPTWTFTDGEGFWAAFFPTIGAGVNNVDLTVVYTPNGDEEGKTDIALT